MTKKLAQQISKLADQIDHGGREVGSLYHHLHNGGAYVKVLDRGWGPELVMCMDSFGKMQGEVRFQTTREGLRRTAEMLLKAADDESMSEGYRPLSPDEVR